MVNSSKTYDNAEGEALRWCKSATIVPAIGIEVVGGGGLIPR
jgi:hypothetical protein